jgi:ATP-dependent helicase HrpB
VAVDVGASSADPSGEATIRLASGVEREWITATSIAVEHSFDAAAGRVRAKRITRYDAIVLAATDVPVDPIAAGHLLTAAILERGPRDVDRQLLARCAAAGIDAAFESLVRTVAPALRTIDDLRLVDGLPPPVVHRLSRDAPVDLPLPSGRRARLDYRNDGRIVAAVKVQELFGLADTPRIGPSRIAVTVELLAPSGRPVQVTSDLRSFWTTGYQEVRRELRARYPRHPWPDDPWTAQPTHRTVKRS